MFQKVRTSYENTIYACYIGYITQAIVNNFVPLLFLSFREDYGLSLAQITFITTMNFGIQLCVDALSARVIDKIGYRRAVAAAHAMAAAGLIGLGTLPSVLPPYPAILFCVVLYAIGGGIIEVLISPIVEACPTPKKEQAMSLLHSFYCWGHLGVILVSTVFFHFAGIGRWNIMAMLWAIVPIFNIFYFLLVPIYPIVPEGEKGMSIRELAKSSAFWILMLLMVCAGASEQAMSQWASAFAESGLHVSKTVGDLLGPGCFALFMGLSRAIYGKFGEKIALTRFMAGSAVLCIACYLTAVFAGVPVLELAACAVTGFSVGIFWPGTFSIAAKALPCGGTALYAMLALAGDVGCSVGPTSVGLIASAFGGRLKAGLAFGVIYPVMMLAGLLLEKKKAGRK